MSWTQTIALVASIIGGTASVIIAVAITTGHIQAQVEAADRRAIAFQAEAAADRRELRRSMGAFQAEMRVFEREMRRLAERQAHVEGALTTTMVGQVQ